MPERNAERKIHIRTGEDLHGLTFDDVVRALEERRSPILLTERRDPLA